MSWAVACLLLLPCIAAAASTTLMDLKIPDMKVTKTGEIYICTAMPMPSTPMKLVGIKPSAKMELVHHILLYGCSEPNQLPENGKAQSSWECMSHGTCKGYSESILYGWAKNAPQLRYPDGVGLSVGLGTKIKWIVLQVHYLNGMPQGDHSGVQLELQPQPTPYAAGMMAYASNFEIPPGQKSFPVKNECCYNGFEPLTTFAVRVHTHTLGRRVWMERKDDKASSNIQILAQRDPQLPQGFIPVNSTRILPGQRLKVTCDFDSQGMTHAVTAGATHDNEMCNMYMMVYSQIPVITMCGDGQYHITHETPGHLPPSGNMVPVPSNMFQPPLPTAAHQGGVWGDVASVSSGENGTIWVLFRGGRVWDQNTFDWQTNDIVDKSKVKVDVVAQLDELTGRVLRSWGKEMFVMTHMITWDPMGFVWVTDVGLHQVLKFTPDGQLVDTIGQALKPGGGAQQLCKPTQVAPMLDGSVMVADGYCNLRVARFSEKGDLMKEALVHDTPPLQVGIDVVHSVVVDECRGVMVVSNRERGKVEVIDLDDMATISVIDISSFGQVWALRRGPYGSILALSWSTGRAAHLLWLDLDTSGIAHGWALPGLEARFPHDFDIGPAPMSLTGAGDRLFAVYVAPLCPGCGPLHKYVLAVGPPEEVAAKMQQFVMPKETEAATEAPNETPKGKEDNKKHDDKQKEEQEEEEEEEAIEEEEEREAEEEEEQEEEEQEQEQKVASSSNSTNASDKHAQASASGKSSTNYDAAAVNETREIIEGLDEEAEFEGLDDEEPIKVLEVAPSSPSPSPAGMVVATSKDKVMVHLPGKPPAEGEVITGTDGNVRYVVIPIHDTRKGFFANGGSMLVMAVVIAIGIAVAAWVFVSRTNRPPYASIPVDEMLKDFEAHPQGAGKSL